MFLFINVSSSSIFTSFSKQVLFGNCVQGALLLRMLFNAKHSFNPIDKPEDFFLAKTYPLDDASKEIVKRVLKIDPNIVSVIPMPSAQKISTFSDTGLMYVETLLYNDHSRNGKIYLRDKTAALLKSDDEKELYSALAVIAHEYNHCLHGDTDSKVLMKKLAITQVSVIGLLFGLEFLFSKFQTMRLGVNIPVKKRNGYIKEGFYGLCGAIYKILIANIVFSQIRRTMETQVDRIRHDDPVELYKLLSGLELFLERSDQSSDKSLDYIVEQGYVPKPLVSVLKFLSKIGSFCFGYRPLTQDRLQKISARKANVLQKYPFIVKKGASD